MNTGLFQSGIQTEDSDIRAHVGVANRCIYVFETQKGRETLGRSVGREAMAMQSGVRSYTARGRVVPWDSIEDIRPLRYYSWSGWDEFHENMTTSEKGALAVRCVCDVIRIGRFPFWIEAYEDDRLSVQLQGTDIVVCCQKKIQVKCDWYAGEKPEGTGNLFLQIAERNPLKRY